MSLIFDVVVIAGSGLNGVTIISILAIVPGQHRGRCYLYGIRGRALSVLTLVRIRRRTLRGRQISRSCA